MVNLERFIGRGVEQRSLFVNLEAGQKTSFKRFVASNPPPTSPPSSTGPYFTRAKKVWLMGKRAGLEFHESEKEAIHSLPVFLKENGPKGS